MRTGGRMSSLGGNGVRAAGATLLAAGVLASVGVAGAAQDETITAVGDATEGQWQNADVTIQTGDTVTWTFQGQGHNVVSSNASDKDPRWEPYAQPGQFEIAPPGAAYSFTFYKSGSYDYICSLHPNMEGTVTVNGEDKEIPTGTPTPSPTATATPTATPTTQPSPPDDDHTTTPAPGTSATVDRTRPRLSRVKARGIRRGARIRFRVSETATVTANVKRRGSRKVLRRARWQVRRGTRQVTIRSRKLRRGRYSVQLRARDAMGNASSLKRAHVRIRR